MTKENQRIKIAEACGWVPSGKFGCVQLWRHGSKPFEHELPNYLEDLNACAEMERVLIEKSKNIPEYEYDFTALYSKELMKLCGTWNNPNWDWGSVCNADLFKAAHATAPQRCEAFLRTLNLWEE